MISRRTAASTNPRGHRGFVVQMEELTENISAAEPR
jgi:hypothetical protein